MITFALLLVIASLCSDVSNLMSKGNDKDALIHIIYIIVLGAAVIYRFVEKKEPTTVYKTPTYKKEMHEFTVKDIDKS